MATRSGASMKRLVVSFGVFVLACSVAPCDKDQEVDLLSFCVAAGGSMTGNAAGGAEEASGGGEGGEVSSCSSPSAFGDTCAENADCHCDVDFCALQPGAASGVCTRSGCVEDPSICPAGWSCLDLKAFDPDLPSICVPPQ